MSEDETTETTEPTSPSVTGRKLAKIGYFDGEIKEIAFNEGDNIQTLVNKADLNFGDGQSINDEDGNEIAITDQAEEGKVYYVVGNYKQGN